MVEKELGERNFGFDSLHSLKFSDMEEKGIVASDCLPLEPRFPLPAARCRGTNASALPAAGGVGAQALPAAETVVPRQREEGLKRESIAGNNLFLLHVVVQCTSD
jgi:hypothetical protein